MWGDRVSKPIDQALRYPVARGLTPLGRHHVVEDQGFVGLVADEDDGLGCASQHALDLDAVPPAPGAVP